MDESSANDDAVASVVPPTSQMEPTMNSSNSCTVCGDLSPWAPETAGLFGATYKSGKQQFVIRIQAKSIVDAADSGCAECLMLQHGLEQMTSIKIRGVSSMVKIVVAGHPRQRSVVAGLQGKDRVEFFSTTVDSVFSAVGPMGLLAHNSSECLPLVNEFLELCTENHGECCPKGPFTLPKRVLDVAGSTEGLSLYVTKGEKEHYMALSHCWGKSQHCKTTAASLPDHQKGIALEALPKTYQDVVTVARKLGIRYVWIDSLCIVQDDKADWEEQAALMGVIYRDALFTIAATHASHGDVGLFSERSEEHLAKRFDFIEQDGKEIFGALLRKPILSHGVYFSGFHRENKAHYPLEERAWCFQERILSTRIVHFTKDELIWECNGWILCECGDVRPGEHARTLRDKYRTVLTATDPQVRATAWMEVVAALSKRKLTYESDRLPALSGLVGCLQEKGFGEYVAGLWLEELPRQLLWVVDNYQKACRPDTYRGPSWSFASIEGSTITDSFNPPSAGIKMIGGLGMPKTPYPLDSINPWSNHARVLACSSGPVEKDRTTCVAKASLQLSAPCQDTNIWCDYEAHRGNKILRYWLETLGGRHCFSPDYAVFREPTLDNVQGIHLNRSRSGTNMTNNTDIRRSLAQKDDGNGEFQNMPKIKALLVAVCTERFERMKFYGQGSTTLHLLVLVKSKTEHGSFERTGVLALTQEGDGEKWLQSAMVREITLI